MINLRHRIDRKEHAQNQFSNKSEFNVHFVEAIEHYSGAIGLWRTMAKIVLDAQRMKDDFIVICEDDHQFTDHYDKHKVNDIIKEAIQKDADVLLGGISWFDTAIQVGDELFWIDRFNATQFTIIFRKFYNKILDADFTENDSADFKISSLTDSAMVIYPYISVQKEFGYSDINPTNGQSGYVDHLFESRSKKLELLKKVSNYYNTNFE